MVNTDAAAMFLSIMYLPIVFTVEAVCHLQADKSSSRVQGRHGQTAHEGQVQNRYGVPLSGDEEA
jgi:hypothetical protein